MAPPKREKTKFARSNLVIGLTGPFGSGCGEMRKVLENFKFHPFKISDDIREELKKAKKLIKKGKDDADYVYFNKKHLVISQHGKEYPDSNGIKRTLKKQAEDFVPLMQGAEGCRGPSSKEVQMASAYAQSNSSTCRKRHVGAVITLRRNGQEFPISMGFNENPPGVSTCLKLEVCCKDENMEAKLGALKNIYCFVCGKKHKVLKKTWLCSKCGTSFEQWLHSNRNMELCTAIHAEERAILSLRGRSAKGGILYVTTFPCFQCARMILDADIDRVIFVEAYPTPETTRYLVDNDVEVEPFGGFTARAFFRVFPKVN